MVLPRHLRRDETRVWRQFELHRVVAEELHVVLRHGERFLAQRGDGIFARESRPRRAESGALAQKFVHLGHVHLADASKPGTVEPRGWVLLHRRRVPWSPPAAPRAGVSGVPRVRLGRTGTEQTSGEASIRRLVLVPAAGVERMTRRGPRARRHRGRFAPAEPVRAEVRRGRSESEIGRRRGRPGETSTRARLPASSVVATRVEAREDAAGWGGTIHSLERRQLLTVVGLPVEREQHVREFVDELLDAELGELVVVPPARVFEDVARHRLGGRRRRLRVHRKLWGFIVRGEAG